MGGQRQLHQDAVESGVLVQVPDQTHQFVLGDVCGTPDGLGEEADLDAVLLFAADVGNRGGVLSHQHHRQPGGQAVGGLQGDRLGLDLIPHLGGHGVSVDDLSGHWFPRVYH